MFSIQHLTTITYITEGLLHNSELWFHEFRIPLCSNQRESARVFNKLFPYKRPERITSFFKWNFWARVLAFASTISPKCCNSMWNLVIFSLNCFDKLHFWQARYDRTWNFVNIKIQYFWLIVLDNHNQERYGLVCFS